MSDWKNVQYKDGKLRTSEGGGGGGSSTFAGLDDVDFSNLQDGQVVKYNAQNEKWENADESGGGGASSMADLDDVDLTGISDGDTLVYDATNQEFIPGTPSGGGNVDDVEVNGTSVVNQNKVAKIVSYKEVTQSQYNALPASKESDGILYCISDAPGGVDGFPPLIYSEEEREIGVWRDGKPLYIKTFDCGAMPNAGHKYIPHNINDLDFVVQAYGVSHSATNNYYFPLPFINVGGIGASVQLHITSTDIVLVTGTSDRRNWNRTYVTLLYTKTTDVAGSGQWSTDGTLTHHYSASEKVIGTWIDGKPLYEKVITGLSVNLAWHNQYRTEGTFSNAPTDIDTLVYIDGFGPSNGNHKAHFGITVYDYGSSSWSLFSLQDGTVTTLIIQYTKTTD